MKGFTRATLGDVAVSGGGEFFIVLLKTLAGDFIPISIGHLEAMMILAGRAEVPPERPLSHDLLLSVLAVLGAEVTRIEITHLELNDEGGTFYAQVVLQKEGEEIVLDARPSDALALAVRQDTPIWVAEDVVGQVGMTDFSGGAEA